MGKCGDKHVAAFQLHGIELLDLAGQARLIQPFLPFRVSLDIAQVNNLGILVFKFINDVWPHLHDVGDQVFTHTMLDVLGVAGAGELHLDAPNVVFELRHIKHGIDPGANGS